MDWSSWSAEDLEVLRSALLKYSVECSPAPHASKATARRLTKEIEEQQWSVLNAERGELINKGLNQGLTEDESNRLDQLNQMADQHLEKFILARMDVKYSCECGHKEEDHNIWSDDEITPLCSKCHCKEYVEYGVVWGDTVVSGIVTDRPDDSD